LGADVKILEEEMDILCYWIAERESIRKKQEAGFPPPWTEDLLLRDFRWCNVRRMDDRVSRWLLNWHRANPDVPVRDRLVSVLAGRLINWPDTLAELPYPAPYDEAAWTDALLKRKRQGHKIFTGAYIINGALGGDKILQVTQKILAPLWKNRRDAPNNPQTMQSMWTYLNGKPGIGSFMAGQAVADLRHVCPELPWTDRHTWAPAGPGSLRGINRLLGRHPDKRIASDDWLDAMHRAYAQARARLPITFKRLEIMDWQSVCCEFDKYRRLTLREGTVRSRYTRNPAPMP
jgi:hypothetical protein